MTDWTVTRVGTARAGWIRGVFAAIGSVGTKRVLKGRVERVPDALREDVGLMREDPRRGWWEYR